jgi:hypothetical protein
MTRLTALTARFQTFFGKGWQKMSSDAVKDSASDSISLCSDTSDTNDSSFPRTTDNAHPPIFNNSLEYGVRSCQMRQC